MPIIKSAEILLYQLQKLYWLEAEFEQLGICDAKLELMGEYKEELDLLESNSQENRSLIENWLNITNTDPSQSKLFNIDKRYDFVGMDAPHVFKILYKYAIYIDTVYEDMINIDQNILLNMLPNESYVDDFLYDINAMSTRQKKSVETCINISGGASTVFGI